MYGLNYSNPYSPFPLSISPLNFGDFARFTRAVRAKKRAVFGGVFVDYSGGFAAREAKTNGKSAAQKKRVNF
jgi:hypothetical protein